MKKLKKCPNAHYTFKDACPICNSPAKSAHYKFVKIKSYKELKS